MWTCVTGWGWGWVGMGIGVFGACGTKHIPTRPCFGAEVRDGVARGAGEGFALWGSNAKP